MGRVAIVTDSASDLIPIVAAEHGIRVVPLYVRFGDAEFTAARLRDGYGPVSVPLRPSSGPIRPGEASPFGPSRLGRADPMIGPA